MHFHLGSQISSIRAVKDALREVRMALLEADVRRDKRKGVLRFYVDGLLVWDASESASWITEAFDRTVNWNIRLQLQMGDSGYGGDPTSTTDLTKTFDTDYAWVTTAPLPVS